VATGRANINAGFTLTLLLERLLEPFALCRCRVATTNGFLQEFLQTATEGGQLRNKCVKWQLIVLRGRRQRLSHDTIIISINNERVARGLSVRTIPRGAVAIGAQ
jgi:hypothetical protein